jgi:hypothetical protein
MARRVNVWPVEVRPGSQGPDRNASLGLVGPPGARRGRHGQVYSAGLVSSRYLRSRKGLDGMAVEEGPVEELRGLSWTRAAGPVRAWQSRWGEILARQCPAGLGGASCWGVGYVMSRPSRLA